MDQHEQASFFIEKLNEKDAEIARLRTELAEARAALGTAKHQRDEWMRFCDKVERELAEARESASKYHAELVDSLRVVADERDTARQERDAAIRERDARIPIASIPTEFVCGEWIMSGQAEPDAVVTYASEPSPETGHVGWCWWARGKMGEARDYVAARAAAEKSIRAHADRSGAPAPQSGPPPGSIATEVERMVRVELAKVTGPVDLEISVRTKPRTFMQEISFELSLVREQTEGCEPAVRTLAEGFDFEQAVRASLAGVSSDELDEVADFLDPHLYGDPDDEPARGFEVPRLLRVLADRFRVEASHG